MTPSLSLWAAGGTAVLSSVGYVAFIRLPLPFDGFSVLVAAVLAGLGTLMLIAWMPRSWVWSETELLREAFQARHDLTEQATTLALEAISTAHRRAENLRNAAAAMRQEVAEQIGTVADKLDSAAREIFYAPERLRDLRAVLLRSELIEEAATAHASLRNRQQSATEDASRAKLLTAVAALDAAFEQTDLQAARGLLQEVEVASEVAERLLTPRHSALSPITQDTSDHEGDHPR